MHEKLDRLYQRICAYSPDDAESCFTFTHRLARENGWTLHYAGRVVDEYKRFMFLAVAAGHPVTPSDQVDQAWHLHLVYTRDYWDDFCGQVLGTPIHHGPTKGGRAETDRFYQQYEQTLASYVKWFQQAPPQDIWPPTDERFSSGAESVWVNKAAAWIIPKPWAGRTTRRSSTWLAGVLIVPLLFGISNPLHFRGPEFLLFYAVVCALAIAVAIVLRHLLRRDEPIDESSPLSPYEVACLARGVPGVLQSSLAGLVAGRRLRVIEVPPGKWGPISLGKPRFQIKADNPPSSTDAVECALINGASLPQGADPKELLESAKPIAEVIEYRLQKKGFLESSASFSGARWWPTAIIAGVWLLGAAKLVVGLSAGKPVGFLIAGLIGLAVVLFAFQTPPRRTRAGDRLLKRLESEQQKLRVAKYGHRETVPLPEIILAAGLFGVAAIDHPDVARLHTAIQSVPSSCGGMGCGSGGCGGGGCGGGCGGCGGCGG